MLINGFEHSSELNCLGLCNDSDARYKALLGND